MHEALLNAMHETVLEGVALLVGGAMQEAALHEALLESGVFVLLPSEAMHEAVLEGLLEAMPESVLEGGAMHEAVLEGVALLEGGAMPEVLGGVLLLVLGVGCVTSTGGVIGSRRRRGRDCSCNRHSSTGALGNGLRGCGCTCGRPPASHQRSGCEAPAGHHRRPHPRHTIVAQGGQHSPVCRQGWSTLCLLFSSVARRVP